MPGISPATPAAVTPLYVSAKREMLSLSTNKFQKMGLRGRLAINACKSIFGRPIEQIGVAEQADMAEGVMCLITKCVPC